MKVRESSMPEQQLWESFFDTESILTQLGLTSACHDLVELGCGYGTFTIPASRRVRGTVFALDIDEAMLTIASERAEEAGRENIEFIRRDFVSDGTGLPDKSVDYVMLFNILHHEHPLEMLREAHRNLREGGLVGVIHWVPDPRTPRGPTVEIRPQPAQCIAWAKEAEFSTDGQILDLPPYHYGLVLRKGLDGRSSADGDTDLRTIDH